MKFKMKTKKPIEPLVDPPPKKSGKRKITFGIKKKPAPIMEEGPIIEAARMRGNKAVADANRIQNMMDEKYGSGEDRIFTVKLGYNTHGLEQGQMLMEVVSTRPIIPADWGIVEWRRFMDHVGALEFRTAYVDIDRYHKLIYGAEYLRNFESSDEHKANACYRQTGNFDPDAENVEQDGRTWGGVDLDGEFMPVEGERGLSHTLNEVKPVREQLQERKESVIEAHKNTLVPVDLDVVRDMANDPELQKWEVAIGIARKPRETWEGKLDWEMEQRVKYCYGWLREIGTVPRPYPQDLLALFWPVPKVLEDNDRANERRAEVTDRLLKFWRKSVSANGATMDLHSESYRVTLAAMELERLIEHHVSNYRRIDHENSLEQLDAVSMGHIKAAAVKYFQAHFPIAESGAGPGPITTSDPPYVEYIRLCRTYGIREGSFLHDALG